MAESYINSCMGYFYWKPNKYDVIHLLMEFYFVHIVCLRKEVRNVQNEIANEKAWIWVHFFIKKGQPQIIEIVLFYWM